MLDLIYRSISLQELIWLIAVAPLFSAFVNAIISAVTAGSEVAKYREWSALFGVIASAISFAGAVVLFFTITAFEAGDPAVITGPLYRWIVSDEVVIDLSLKIDQLSMVMSLLISGLGLLTSIYSIGYMWKNSGFARYFALLGIFLFAMMLLVLADNLAFMFIGWSAAGIVSSFLVGLDFFDRSKRVAAVKTFAWNSFSDVLLLAGIFLVYGVMSAGDVDPKIGIFSFESMERHAFYFLPVATTVSILMFAACAIKSAQLPFHTWLLDSMKGPTPISGLAHSAVMVCAGAYLMVRLNFILVMSGSAMSVIYIFGIVAALCAAVFAVGQRDIKKLLAYSTISQIGLIFTSIGVGAFSAAVFHLVAHSIFKLLLFFSAGSAIYALGGERDLMKMGGLKRIMPLTAWTFVIGAVALAGIFPASGFFSRDAILWQLYERGHLGIWFAGFAVVGITSFYIFRAVGAIFFGEPNFEFDQYKKISESPVSMIIPMMILATLTIFGGFIGASKSFGGGDYFGRWIGALIADEVSRAPAAASRSMELILTVATMIWSAHFSILSWVIYAQKRDWPGRITSRLGPIHALVANGFYFDALYERIFARGTIWVSKKVIDEYLDRKIVDGVLVGGISKLVWMIGIVASIMGNGLVQRYLLYFLIGAAVAAGYLAL
ncbi:MAG TPA: NADH-quinone oxidoreductase subunit L [bacterium]|nr:NADH-quinone oxidoreductase subunit L [bacterium]